tara:strand:- start:2096 stop:2287 length:192 start_codon:yes stop_codon:yes gene_type:complete
MRHDFCVPAILLPHKSKNPAQLAGFLVHTGHVAREKHPASRFHGLITNQRLNIFFSTKEKRRP